MLEVGMVVTAPETTKKAQAVVRAALRAPTDALKRLYD
jgi:hypothetical protein